MKNKQKKKKRRSQTRRISMKEQKRKKISFQKVHYIFHGISEFRIRLTVYLYYEEVRSKPHMNAGQGMWGTSIWK